MNNDRWQQIDELLDAALDQPVRERAAFLAATRAGDELLRLEVEALLQADVKAESFMDAPALAMAAEMLKQLGAGGMGEVWLAEDTRLGRKVALKLLPARFTLESERVRRFQQEGRAASALNHPNIVTIYDIGEVKSSFYLATEYIEGHTLGRQIRVGRMKLLEALDVVRQVATALAAAHAAGIVHRDIKPENIMVRPDGLVKCSTSVWQSCGRRSWTETMLPL